MPRSLFQRIVATAMLVSTAALIFLTVRETLIEEPRTAEPRPAVTIPEVLAATSPATTVESAPQPRRVAKPAPAQPLTRLLLVASGGDAWLDVRAGSASGRVLFAGLLTQGRQVEVKAKQLWVRFGGAANVTARLNGKPLPLRAGTYNALISRSGLRLVAG